MEVRFEDSFAGVDINPFTTNVFKRLESGFSTAVALLDVCTDEEGGGPGGKGGGTNVFLGCVVRDGEDLLSREDASNAKAGGIMEAEDGESWVRGDPLGRGG